jgi:hydrogenase maturation protein HypF
MTTVRIRVRVTGIVQGVGFRPFVYRIAVRHKLNGYVRNRGDAGVEILLEGKENEIRGFLKDLKTKKPPLAQIHRVITSKVEGKNEYPGFAVQKSSNETELSGSIIPPDIAICEDCLRELRDPEDPRYEYFFITCTNCGPRFTIIEKLPYDRENTTMREFPMCSFCLKEFTDPLNRRFHAQTVACPKCGPRVWLATGRGEPLEHEDPIREAGRLLSEGNIIATKGYGGFHIAASITETEPLVKMRAVKHRRQKPFAIMARSLAAIETFAEVSEREASLLKSYSRPIVLLNKRRDYYLSELVSPELHSIGVMLPYSGLHHMLFDKVKDSAFVMTSANPPNQPIVKNNEEAVKTLANTVDYFLFHNRQIAHRCDDSVLRMHDDHTVFLRRSRGYAPAPIMLKEPSRSCVLALGGELNNAACVLNEDKAFISQHIGDVENVETRSFLEAAAKHIIHLTNSKVETIACDLHPKFTTTALARELAEANGWQVSQIQHHFAHTVALMMEHSVDEMVGICCDGYGYGSDGEAWGGEILLCKKGSHGFKRLSHLENQPLLGGDQATRFPLRMAAGILYDSVPIEEWLFQNEGYFPYGKQEIELILEQLKNQRAIIRTSSCGRVLDAVSAVLGICFERTYEGEPSMKLESAAMKGNDVLKLNPIIRNDELVTTQMLTEIFSSKQKYDKRDLAYCAHIYIAKGLAALAVQHAEENRIKTIGFSGGVACNEIIATAIRKIIEDAGLRFLVHEATPAGDGGISFGQAVASGFFE